MDPDIEPDAEPVDPYATEPGDAEPDAEPGEARLRDTELAVEAAFEPTLAPIEDTPIADRPAPEPELEIVRYAPAILAVDAAAIGLAIYGVEHGDRYYWMAGGAFLAAPFVHLLAGDGDTLAHGLGARTGIPVGLGLLGGLTGVVLYGLATADLDEEGDFSSNDDPEYSLGEFALGGTLIGAGIGVLVGGAYTYYRETRESKAARAARTSRWTPLVAPGKSGISLGVAGHW